jgi:hypothetical protein
VFFVVFANYLLYKQQQQQQQTTTNSPDFRNLKQAVEQVSSIATEVNEAIREQENFQKVVDIQKSFEGMFVVFVVVCLFVWLVCLVGCFRKCQVDCCRRSITRENRRSNESLQKSTSITMIVVVVVVAK